MIPLPGELSGILQVRTIRIDGALLYLVTASLSGLVDGKHYQQTGTLSVEQAVAALEAMLDDYMQQP